VQVQNIFFLLWLLCQPSTNIFALTIHYFNSFVHIAQQAGQAVVLGRLSFSMCSFIEKKSIGFFNVDKAQKIYYHTKQLS
jgi:hypothetical protein